MFSGGEGVSPSRGEGIGLTGQLGKWINCGVGGGKRISGGGHSGRAWGVGFAWVRKGSVIFVFLNCSLYWVIGAIVGLLLPLQQREDNSSENHSEVVSRECPQKLVESPVHQQDKYAGVSSCEGRVKGFGDLYGKMWHCKSSKELSDKGIVSEEDVLRLARVGTNVDSNARLWVLESTQDGSRCD